MTVLYMSITVAQDTIVFGLLIAVLDDHCGDDSDDGNDSHNDEECHGGLHLASPCHVAIV